MPRNTAAGKGKAGKLVIPTPTRVGMPAGYTPDGTKFKFLPFSFADTRLRRAHNYWVCSTRPDMRPHTAPIWGLWMDAAFYFSTDPSSTKARNLSANPAIIVHVESGDEVVIVEGRCAPCELTKAHDTAYFRKYKHHLFGFPAPMVMLRVEVAVIMAWREKDFSSSTTRWTF